MSYPVCVEQTVRSQAEKTASKAKKEAKKVKSSKTEARTGTTKGSKNQKKSEHSYPRITTDRKDAQSASHADQPFASPSLPGNGWSFSRVFSSFSNGAAKQLHLKYAKLRLDAALCFPWDGKGHKCKYGKRVDYANIPDKLSQVHYRKSWDPDLHLPERSSCMRSFPAAQCGHPGQNQPPYPRPGGASFCSVVIRTVLREFGRLLRFEVPNRVQF